ncbi:MAG: UDP-N-acetylmuramoyl-L-alanyl-D-glutamate--2,6-diaminopimelate ligase [Flavobacteriaceae bacterium]
MKNLQKLLYKVSINSIYGNTNISIENLSYDSREIKKNSIFFAIKGENYNGFDYINESIKKGAIAVLCKNIPIKIDKKIVYVIVENVEIALGIISSNFYDNPSSKMKLVGITGTNGKTTTTTLLHKLFKDHNLSVGLISTISINYNNKVFKTNHTTPDSITINSFLKSMIDEGVSYCFMEVSSHGIRQNRTSGLEFYGAVFTNISHDHLDYHKNFENYRDTKKSFFDNLSRDAFALTNIDDKNGLFMLQNTKAKKYTLSIKKHADFNLKVSENLFSGMLLIFQNNEFWTKLVGRFNALNILTVIAVSKILELETVSVLKKISKINNVNGRFQIYNSKKSAKVIIDYAHTPIALENVLNTINEIRTKNENIITVVGCGGNRDKEKRPVIAKKAALLSDKVILTSDNPRNENPKKIIEDMLRGVSPIDYKKIIKVIDREEAIMASERISQPGDIVLIAGKGHENYQEINGKKKHFDDYEIVKKYF